MKKLLLILISCCIFLACGVVLPDAKADIPEGVKDHYNYNTSDTSIKIVKERLRDLGYFKKDAQFTNVVSDELKKAVISFQKMNDMKANGTINKEFLEKLFSDDAIAKDGTKKESPFTLGTGGIIALIFIGLLILMKPVCNILKRIHLRLRQHRMKVKLQKANTAFENLSNAVNNAATALPQSPRIFNGYDYEEFVARWLMANNYTNVQVTSKTGDFGADVLATSPEGVRFAVQCKYWSNPVGYKAVQEVISGMHYYNCGGAMVVTNNTYTNQAIEGANRMGVLLYQYIA